MHVKSFFTIIGQFINVLNYGKNSMHCCSYRPRGVLRISSDGDNRRIFRGLKFSIPGFFWVGKVFFVWLDLSGDLSRDFWGYSKQSEDSL